MWKIGFRNALLAGYAYDFEQTTRAQRPAAFSSSAVSTIRRLLRRRTLLQIGQRLQSRGIRCRHGL